MNNVSNMEFLTVILLLSMIFCHIVDDYYLQGFLASAKQKSWWEKNLPDKLYKNDYIIALFEHAFSWTFMIHVPIAVFILLGYLQYNTIAFVIVFVGNWVFHATIDHMKANCHLINLVQDQLLHIFQIYLTWLMYVL